jgi:hypothetical protein
MVLKNKIIKTTPANVGTATDRMYVHSMFRLYGIICAPCITGSISPLALYFDAPGLIEICFSACDKHNKRKANYQYERAGWYMVKSLKLMSAF